MFELPKLPYAYNALEPFIDELTMTIHHTKHHAAYVDNANKALSGTPFGGAPVADVVMSLDSVPDAVRTAVRNNAGGHLNHSLFWQMMGPGKGGSPGGELEEAISKKFGGFDKFTEQMNAAGVGRFGSGWAWLVLNKGELEIMSTPNQDNPITEGKQPILGIDVWEHSYYLKWKSNRAEYLKNWWNVANWDFMKETYVRLIG
jgi:Fe-Mn family superoxide dismutase